VPAPDEMTAWLDARLAEAGGARVGTIEVPRVRPWATVMRAPTTLGPVWLKATAPDTRFELEVYVLLGEVAPEHVLTPLAIDAARGWLLLPDGGPSLGERFGGAELTGALAAALPQYAELQRAAAPHLDRLLAAGLADMRPQVMPRRFAEALAIVRPWVERAGDAADRATLERLDGLHDTVAEWSQRLAAAPGAATIDHDDLHARNMLAAGDGGLRGIRFYDWGDAVAAHPFASLHLPVGMAAKADVEPLRDAYLAAFADLAPHGELVATLELACRLAKIARAHVWHRATGAGATPPAWERAPFACLESLLGPSPYGAF
jgi:hypothetical protein